MEKAIIALITDALGIVRAALVDWPVTARLCLIIIVAATGPFPIL